MIFWWTLGMEFFTKYKEASQYRIKDIIGKLSYGVVAATVDTQTGEQVAIKKINDLFEHASNATRILWEIKLSSTTQKHSWDQTHHACSLPGGISKILILFLIFKLRHLKSCPCMSSGQRNCMHDSLSSVFYDPTVCSLVKYGLRFFACNQIKFLLLLVVLRKWSSIYKFSININTDFHFCLFVTILVTFLWSRFYVLFVGNRM